MSAPAIAGSDRPFGGAEFEIGRSPLSPFRATLALWWLAAKRNGGVLFLPVIAGVMWWLVRDSHVYMAVPLWMPTVQGIGYTLVIAGPLTAALASWTAGRSHRRGMADLLATAPLPRGWSTVADWLGITFWALAVYLGCAAVALAWTATQVTWGRPELWPILIAAIALAVCAAGGMLVGSLWPSRFLPPLLAIAVGFLIVGPTGIWQLDRVKMLSPMGPIDSVVREPLDIPDLRMMLPHLRWLVALGVALVLALVVRQNGGWLARALLGVSVVAVVVTGSGVYGYRSQSWTTEPVLHAVLPYEPVCVTDAVTVCLHPAYTAVTDEVVATVNGVSASLSGVAGTPTRYEQIVGGRPLDAGTVSFQLWAGYMLHANLAHELSWDMVVDRDAMARYTSGGYHGGIVASQAIVAAWIMLDYQQRTGLDGIESFPGPALEYSLVESEMVGEGEPFFRCLPFPGQLYGMDCTYDDEAAASLQALIDAATDRFFALDPEARRAWLEANWTRLRSGLVTLKGMP